MSNRQLEEKQQEQSDRELAKQLGIEYNELSELDYEIHENQSKDGLVYGTYIEFKENSNKDILKKISGLSKNNTLDL